MCTTNNKHHSGPKHCRRTLQSPPYTPSPSYLLASPKPLFGSLTHSLPPCLISLPLLPSFPPLPPPPGLAYPHPLPYFGLNSLPASFPASFHLLSPLSPLLPLPSILPILPLLPNNPHPSLSLLASPFALANISP